MKTFKVDGLRFRDLDHDGVLAPFEDHRLPPDVRARDLVSRMTLNEKAGVMMHGTARSHGPLGVLGVGDRYDLEANERLIAGSGINHVITRLDADPASFARQNNELQEIAAGARLGIPVTISTDPRHHFVHVTGASSRAEGFSQWPETTGLAAIGSADLVEQFARIAAEEYCAVGIHVALSPQADIATEPRWSRISGTFGEDPTLARALVAAYVRGMQGTELGAASVCSVVKHWVGYPAAPEGFDGHNAYGRFSTVSEESLKLHIEAFLGSFEAGVAGVMPTYTILKDLTLDGEPLEQVAGGFNAQLVNGLLRRDYGFDGFVLSDWAIYKDATDDTFDPKVPQQASAIAMPWGVEDLTREQRFAKSVNAGIDQLGGEEDVDTLIRVVEGGLVEEPRIDEAVLRMLIPKFRQGLFENPLVDAELAAERVGSDRNRRAGLDAQRRSVVCLKKPTKLNPGARPRLVNFAGRSEPDAGADVAIIRLETPSETLHPHFFFGSRMAEGDMDFKPDSDAMQQVKKTAAELPTIGVIQMPRPAVLTGLMDFLDGVYVDLGVADEILLQVILEGQETEGRLPFELPSSMEAVRSQRPDLPCDSQDPLFPIRGDWRTPIGIAQLGSGSPDHEG